MSHSRKRAGRTPDAPSTYVSLFSSAGVGCYGFLQEGFRCVATVETLERRLRVQRHNGKCTLESGYICGDMTLPETQDRVAAELERWQVDFGAAGLDVLIATPPCQGMSVANHKKGDERGRNSLVVESIRMTDRLRPKFFVFENVRAFLSSACTDLDGAERSIGDAIGRDLGGAYNILCRVVNFKDYGCPSSRTRTLVIGARKDLTDASPYSFFPDKRPERTLRQIIGHLPPLTTMGQISDTDIYHSFKSYAPAMEAWIAGLGEGQSAFDNADSALVPHSVRDGKVVPNARKNGDKYTRQRWDAVAPCVHTRNDILASQNTVHPADNRVFSIRELMLMMSVPDSFRWTDRPLDELNAMPPEQKRAFLKKEEMNIRQCLGEAVPTAVFRQVAGKIKDWLQKRRLTDSEVKGLVDTKSLEDTENLLAFVRGDDKHDFVGLTKIAEIANAKRDDLAAYYTRQDICFPVVASLPPARNSDSISILEPSAGVGSFLPSLVAKYSDVRRVTIDLVDIDASRIELLKELTKRLEIPANIELNYVVADFLTYRFDKKYDIVVGNPPFKKITNDDGILASYKSVAQNKETNNVFAFFLEKAMSVAKHIALIVPKSLINAPEFNTSRNLLSSHRITRIVDFGEKGFKGVKIETVSVTVAMGKTPDVTTVESYVTGGIQALPQSYVTDPRFPYWLIYRNREFDAVADNMEMGIFRAYRDRAITKRVTSNTGKVRVLKSRNIGSNRIIDLPGYDSFVERAEDYDVAKYLGRTDCVLIPNLTYKPRACFMPNGCIADGSVAILTIKDGHGAISEDDLAFYATEQFAKFYAVARNMGTRSLNIDNNSVFFFGRHKNGTT